MTRKILLTSLSAAESGLPVRYFSIRNESGSDYCDAILDAEAGIKAMLARFDIDEIIVIGAAGSNNEEDDLTPFPLRHGSALYTVDETSLSTYGLLQRRIAKYADEQASNQKEEDRLLPAETMQKLDRFIQGFKEKEPGLKTINNNRLFDALAQNNQTYESFWNALFEACPELRSDAGACRQWVKNYLYAELDPSAKLKLLPANEAALLRFITEADFEDTGQWIDSMMTMEQSIVEDEEDIDLYISLNSEDAADTFIVLNMLDVLVSMPKSGVRLKKIFTLRNLQKCMTGIIRDDTEGFGVTELFHAIRAFLKYGRADMIADLWERSGEQNESVAGMVYAMRDVDIGLSMCNIPEIEGGILRLRELFRSEKFWRESGYYGMQFSIIAESIREDYGTLMEGDGRIPFIDLVKWAYRHQFYQQTLTLIESKAPEELVESGIFYYCGAESDKDQVIRLFAEKRLELKPYEYYKIDESINHYFIKAYNRDRTRGRGEKGEDRQHVYAVLRAESVKNNDPSQITGLTACDSMETLLNLLFAYYHIGEVRNKISHADANAMADKRLVASEGGEVSALTWMKDAIDFFIDSYDKAMAQVQDKKPQVIFITSDDVRTTAEQMKSNNPESYGRRGPNHRRRR